MHSRSRVLPSAGALALLLVAGSPRALASGFQLREQSASGQGLSFAGMSAGGTDISSMFFNPAALTRYDGTRFQLGFAHILPSTDFSQGSASRATSPLLPPLPQGSGPIQGSASHGNAAESALTPNLYLAWAPSQDLRLGLSVNVPYGLTTQYEDGWIGRYHALRSHLETIDISPAVAYRFNDVLSGGVAFVARRAKAELSQAVDFGYQAWASIQGIRAVDPTFSNTNPATSSPIVVPGAADGSVSVSGDAWAYGFKAGLLFEPSRNLHIGLGYQSAMDEKIKGNATFQVPPTVGMGLAALAQVNPGPQHQGELALLTSGFQAATANNAVRADLNLPACATLGVAWDVSPTFTLSAEVERTTWSRFKDLTLRFPDAATQPDNTTHENWKDTTFVSLGAECHPTGPWSYRLGVAVDQAPVSDATRTPRIPDADRTWVSAGTSYAFSRTFALDLGVTHIFAKDANLDLKGGQDPRSSDFFKGNLSGTYKNSIDIWSLQARWIF